MRAGSFAAALYAGLVYAFIFLPVIVLAVFSLQASHIPVPPFNGPSLQWYREIFSDRHVLSALWNSVRVALASSLASVLLGFLAAYGLARFRPYGVGLMRGFLVAPLSVSYLIIGMGLLVTFNAVGVPKSLLAVGLGHVVINLPLCFAIIYSQMGEHQALIERAARDLGAKDWQVLALITAPLLSPALLASFFLSVTLSWDEFIIAFLLTRFDNTLPVEIWDMLRSGLNPKTNAIGTLVFLVSGLLVVAMELIAFRWARR